MWAHLKAHAWKYYFITGGVYGAYMLYTSPGYRAPIPALKAIALWPLDAYQQFGGGAVDTGSAVAAAR